MVQLSIIVPVYNAAQYLSECIQSIIQQTYRDWELILINDGSTDSSLSICLSYVTLDDRISVHTQENKGQAAARNKGLEHSRGKYIVFIDADDTVSNNLFDENIKILEADVSIDLLQFPLFRGYGSSTAKLRAQKQKYIVGQQFIFKSWIEENTVSWIVCDKLFKKDLFTNLRFVEGMIYEDNYLMAEILPIINKIFISENGVYYYHFRENSTTTSPLSMKKELDTQNVSLNILKKLVLYQSNVNLQIILLNRIFNVYQSLYHNFNFREKPDANFTDVLKSKSLLSIFNSKLPFEQRIKLILARFIGPQLFLRIGTLGKNISARNF